MQTVPENYSVSALGSFRFKVLFYMGNNSVPKFIFRLSRFPVYRGAILGRFYCTIIPSTPWSSNESLSFRVPHYNTLKPCTRHLEDKELTHYHVCALTSTHRLNTQLPPGFVAQKHVLMKGSSCNLYSSISKQSFTTEPRAEAQFIK